MRKLHIEKRTFGKHTNKLIKNRYLRIFTKNWDFGVGGGTESPGKQNIFLRKFNFDLKIY
jgi:hypothetical protein